jgi:hypothetical protein
MKNFPFFPVFVFFCGVIVGMWLHGCSCGKSGVEVVSSKSDTVFIAVHDSAKSKPEITFIEGGRIPDKVDTVTVIKKFFEKVAYADTVRMGANIIRIYDTVSQNQLSPLRKVFLDGSIPVITNAITLREKPRTKAYLGANGFGNLTELAVGPSLALKLKNDQIIEAGAMINTRSQWTYLFSMKFPISLRKK